jgi:hypothetical protein
LNDDRGTRGKRKKRSPKSRPQKHPKFVFGFIVRATAQTISLISLFYGASGKLIRRGIVFSLKVCTWEEHVMKLRKSLLVSGLTCALLVFLIARVRAQKGTVSAHQSVSDKRDGQHDFDFLVGSWKFHLKRLKRRLAGSTEWVEFDGTTVCRKLLDGRAEMEEMNVESADKHIHIQGLALRLYNPESHQWSIYCRSPISGAFTGPTRPMES